MRTTDVARESGYSAQQVRDLERLGVIPAARRSGNGYRSYTPLHVRALRAYRAPWRHRSCALFAQPHTRT